MATLHMIIGIFTGMLSMIIAMSVFPNNTIKKWGLFVAFIVAYGAGIIVGKM